jgi:hypothetical protein
MSIRVATDVDAVSPRSDQESFVRKDPVETYLSFGLLLLSFVMVAAFGNS